MDDVRPPTLSHLEDVFWCYAHLDHPNTQTHAPTPGAWNMLQWARSARSRFYLKLLPRALHARANGEEARQAQWERMIQNMTPAQAIAGVREWEWDQEQAQIAGVPPELVADAEKLVAQWRRATKAEMSDEGAESLVCQMVQAISECVDAARRRPEAFAKYRAESE